MYLHSVSPFGLNHAWFDMFLALVDKSPNIFDCAVESDNLKVPCGRTGGDFGVEESGHRMYGQARFGLCRDSS